MNAWFKSTWFIQGFTRLIEFLQAEALVVGMVLLGGPALAYGAYRLLLQWRRYRAGADPRRWAHLFSPTPAGNEQRSGVLLGSHRGFGKRASPPENSEAAFHAAVHAGIDCIETDIIMTADGVPVIRHGPTAALAGRPDLKLKNLTLAQMRELDFSSYLEDEPDKDAPDSRPTTKGARENESAWTGFLTLEEFLEKYVGRVIINLELKRWDIIDWRFERKVAAILAPYVRSGARIFCSSFNPFALLRMRRYLPELCLGMLWRDDLNWFARNRSLMFFTRPDFIHPHEKRLDSKLADYAREKGYRIHTWVVNDPVRFRELTDLGASMIITDNVREGLTWAGRGASHASPVGDVKEDVLPAAM